MIPVSSFSSSELYYIYEALVTSTGGNVEEAFYNVLNGSSIYGQPLTLISPNGLYLSEGMEGLSDLLGYNYYKNKVLNSVKDIIVANTTFTFRVKNINIINPNTYDVFLKLYNDSTATIGVTPTEYKLQVPANGSYNLNDTNSALFEGQGLAVACTKLLADTDVTALATNVEIYLTYKQV